MLFAAQGHIGCSAITVSHLHNKLCTWFCQDAFTAQGKPEQAELTHGTAQPGQMPPAGPSQAPST